VEAVREISFTVAEGEIFGLLGPNGAGKTTTMRILTCYFPPSSGTAQVAGFDILENSLEVRKNIGYLPENVPLYQDMPVAAYLHFVARIKGVPHKEHARRVAEVMDECALTEYADFPIGKISRGYRQRVGLAQAIISRPPVLILDEPTVGLDPRQIVKVRELIRELKSDHTILLSTHILSEVELVCDRVLIIDRGKIVASGTPETLRQQMSQTPGLVLALKGEITEADGVLRQIPGVTHAARMGAAGETRVLLEAARETDIREPVFREVVARGWTLLEMTPRQASLEDVFVRLVSQDAAAAPTDPVATVPADEAEGPDAGEAVP